MADESESESRMEFSGFSPMITETYRDGNVEQCISVSLISSLETSQDASGIKAEDWAEN